MSNKKTRNEQRKENDKTPLARREAESKRKGDFKKKGKDS